MSPRKGLFWRENLPGAAAGPAAEPPPRAEPEGFDGVETACGRRVRFAEIFGGSGAGPFGGGRIFGKEVTCRGRAAVCLRLAETCKGT